MHDDGPQVILPVPDAPERVAERLRKARGILARAGFDGAGVEDQEQTLLIRLPPADLPRLQDEALREGVMACLKSLGYAFVALDITPADGDQGS